MSKCQDLTNRVFGRLTVIKRAENKGSYSYWQCKCDCGKLTIVRGSHLRNEKIRSCGCLSKEIAKERATNNIKHGLTHTRIYGIWHTMKTRCYNKKSIDYRLYGARGITVCEKWRTDFQAFYNWAMSHGYADNLTIDRIDPDGNYEPSNCRWITRKEQANNRRNNHKVRINGEELTLPYAAEKLGVEYKYLQNRICRDKWDIEKVIKEIEEKGA